MVDTCLALLVVILNPRFLRMKDLDWKLN